MADPTAGPRGTTIQSTNLAGADANPAGSPYTLNFSGANHSDYRILAHILTSTSSGSGNNQIYINTAQYGPDSELFWQFGALGANTNDWFDGVIRLINPDSGAGGSQSLYEVEWNRLAGGTFDIDLYKIVVGSATHPKTFATAQTVSAGDWYAITTEGTASTVISVWKWNGTSSWNQVGTSYTDSSSPLTGAGYFGFEQLKATAYSISAWGGGTIVPSIPTRTSMFDPEILSRGWF